MSNKVLRTIKNPKLLKLLPLYLRGRERYMKAFNAYNNGVVELPYQPIVVRVEPTNKCNLRCIMCPTGCSDAHRETGFMDFGLYEKIISEASVFKNPTWIMLYLGGESLLHKDLGKMIKLAKSKGLYCRFSTNATLLAKGNSEALLRSGLDSICFSFDDVSPTEYEGMRRGASYFHTLKNIRGLLQMKEDMGLLQPLVTIDSLRLHKPTDTAIGSRRPKPTKEFRSLFAGYDVQNIACMWAHLWAGDFGEKHSYSYQRDRVYRGQCSLPWTDITINWKGQAVACCYDLEYDYVISDVNEHTLLEVWNNESMVRLRRKLLAREFQDIGLCRSCSVALGEV